MAFLCNACGAPAVELDRVLELGPDDDSDEVTLQTARCTACKAVFLAVYEESRRGAGEAWHHDAWLVDATTLADVEARLAACPAPRDHRCACATHATLRGEYRRWLTGASAPLRR